MKVSDLITQIDFEVIATQEALNKEIYGAIVGDLLSYVMGNGSEGNVWISVQAHMNVVAVSLLKEFSCLILIGDVTLEEEVIEKAKAENFAILRSSESAYAVCGMLLNIGI